MKTTTRPIFYFLKAFLLHIKNKTLQTISIFYSIFKMKKKSVSCAFSSIITYYKFLNTLLFSYFCEKIEKKEMYPFVKKVNLLLIVTTYFDATSLSLQMHQCTACPSFSLIRGKYCICYNQATSSKHLNFLCNARVEQCTILRNVSYNTQHYSP